MHVVNISLDPKIIDPESPAATRVKAYGELVDSYSVVTPTPVTTTEVLSDRATVYGISGSNKLFQLWHIYRKLESLIVAGKCDVIASADMYYLGFAALVLARRYHCGLEINVLGMEKLSWWRKWLATYVLHNASTVRALSQRLERRLKEEFDVPADLITVVPIYVPTDSLGFDVHTLNATERTAYETQQAQFKSKYGQTFNFLTVSRLVPIKNISLQLEALQQVVTAGHAVTLHIVGDGPERANLEREVRNRKLSDRVVFHGRQTGAALGSLYQNCDCFLLTSHYEGWGMVIVEAATAGLPVIMTDVGCAGEFLIDGEGGMVIPVGDAPALRTAMERMVTESGLRETYAHGVKKALTALPSFADVTAQYQQHWQHTFDHKL